MPLIPNVPRRPFQNLTLARVYVQKCKNFSFGLSGLNYTVWTMLSIYTGFSIFRCLKKESGGVSISQDKKKNLNMSEPWTDILQAESFKTTEGLEAELNLNYEQGQFLGLVNGHEKRTFGPLNVFVLWTETYP